MTKEVLKESVERILRTKYLKRLSEATELEILNSISDVIMEQLSDNWLRTTRAYKKVKQVHYLSIEYLIGRSFTNNLINVLEEGADKLTLADMNEESANMLALQTRQQLAINSLSLASQAAQSVLKLF